MVTNTRVFKIKRLEPNQLTKYFWKDGDLAYSDNQLHFNDAGKAVVLADKDYVQGTVDEKINTTQNTVDEKIETNTNIIMDNVPVIVNSIVNAVVTDAVNNAINVAVGVALLSAYPVGAIYMSVVGTDPSALFGGTWEYWGSGRMPVSCNPNDANFAGIEQTGGASAVALSPANMPSLTTINNSGGNFSAYLRSDALTLGTPGNAYGWSIHNGSQISPATTTVGTSESFSILNPYITCYMWKRVG